MDGGRKADLAHLNEASKTATSQEKQELERIKRKILSQPKEITKLRERLINASRRGQGADVARLSEQIKAFERRTNKTDSWKGVVR